MKIWRYDDWEDWRDRLRDGAPLLYFLLFVLAPAFMLPTLFLALCLGLVYLLRWAGITGEQAAITFFATWSALAPINLLMVRRRCGSWREVWRVQREGWRYDGEGMAALYFPYFVLAMAGLFLLLGWALTEAALWWLSR